MGKRAELTRQHILEQGMLVIQDKGFENTTIKDICDAAEVSVGSFYSHFKNKYDLLRNYSQKDRQEFVQLTEEQITGSTAEEKLLQLVRNYAWLNIGNGYERLAEAFSPQSGRFSVTTPFFGMMRDIVKEGVSNGEFAKALDVDDYVGMIKILLRGCCYEWIMEYGQFDLEETMIRYVSRIIAQMKGEEQVAP